MNNLHPGVRWVYRKKAYLAFFPILFFIAILSWAATISTGTLPIVTAITAFMASIFTPIVIIIVIGEIYARMSYNRFLYEITNEGVKIEQGIIWKKYTSIPYERVQNVEVKRGIIARMFGFSTVEIETAGQSGMNSGFRVRWVGKRRQEYKSEGHLPGVSIEDAENIRVFVMKKIKHTSRDSGI